MYLYALQPPVSKTNDPPVSNQTAYIRNQTRGKLKRVPKVRKEVLGFIIAQNEKSNLDPDILAFHVQCCRSSSVQNPSLWGGGEGSGDMYKKVYLDLRVYVHQITHPATFAMETG